MKNLWLDTETFSECDLRKSGGYAYAYHPTTRVRVVTYAIDDGAPQLWVELPGTLGEWGPMPRDLAQALHNPDVTITAHNAFFDRHILKARLGIDKPLRRWRCTLSLALAHSLPASLDMLGLALGLPEDAAKLKAGNRLVMLFCKPRPGKALPRVADRNSHPDDWAAYCDYALRDIVAMRECYYRMPKWNEESDRGVWLLDQTINDRGFGVDVDLATRATALDAETKAELAERTADATFGLVGAATQRADVIKYLDAALGCEVENLRASTLEKMLVEGLCSPEVEELLRLRLESATSAAAKYRVVLASQHDGRIRGGLQYCGAMRTGRWAGRLFQPQNMARPTLPHAEIDAGIAALKDGVADLVVDDMTKLLSSALRGVIVPRPGKELLVADLSNIEGRVLAWLADETWKIRAFADFDHGQGHDLYVLAYAKSFGVTPEAVLDNKKHGDGKMRQIGKVQELALGYQGGPNAFGTMAATYRINLDGLDLKTIVNGWRKAHPGVTRLWRDLQDAFLTATVTGETTRLSRDRLVVSRKGAWVRIRLPSGRYLQYPSPRVDETGGLTYMGQNPITRKWCRLSTYGGKLVENVVQAVARDIIASGIGDAEQEGLAVVLSVHDEILAEAEPGTPVSILADSMTNNPAWSNGLPLAAAGFSCVRYRKDG